MISKDLSALRALRNKAAFWTTEALKDMIDKIPVPVKMIHSKNKSEFILFREVL